MTENEVKVVRHISNLASNYISHDEGLTHEEALTLDGLLKELQQYRAIGTVEECRTAMERMKPKKAEYKKMVYPKHKWREDDGEIDEWAFSVGYCNGPVCERCHHSFCVHCNPKGWDDTECVVKDYICPSCGENVSYKSRYCNCGQIIDWSK